MKTEQEILERIEHIKTLSNGYGINERRIKELEWVLKPSKLSQHDVIKNEVAVCDNEWHESNMQHFGECHACGEKAEY